MSVASLKFVERLRVVYGDPITENIEAFMKEYARVMHQYTEAELDFAADLLLHRHKGPHRWPRVPECSRAAEDARATLRPPEKIKRPIPEGWSNERAAHADKLIQCDLGRRAAREGWIVQLWDYCRREGKLPDRVEIERPLPPDPRKYGGLIAEARRFDKNYAMVCDPNADAMTKSLKSLGDAMLARRDRLSEIANPAGRDA